MKNLNKDDWFLIDWTDAKTRNLQSPHPVQLNPACHSPKVNEPDHGGEVDIWGVGHCLIELASKNRVNNASEVQNIGKRWQNDGTPTAVEALAEIEVLDFDILSLQMCCIDVQYVTGCATFLFHWFGRYVYSIPTSRACDDKPQGSPQRRSQKDERQKQRDESRRGSAYGFYK